MMCKRVLGITVVLSLASMPWLGATTLSPGIYASEDFTADPESVQVLSVNDMLEDETIDLNLEVYELESGLYRLVSDPAAKTDEAVLNSGGAVYVSDLIGGSGADGILLRGNGAYPGAVSISFGLLRDYADLPLDADGYVDVEAAAQLTGPDSPARFYAGRGYLEVDGVILVLENLSIGDHTNNNTGALQSDGDSPTLIMNDVWVHNVYDGVFWYNSGIATARFSNCIFYGTFQPWTNAADRDAAGYTYADANASENWELIVPGRPTDVWGVQSGDLFDDMHGLPEGTHPGVRVGNDTASGYNTNLFTTENDTLVLRMDHCTIVKHDTRSSTTWRHNGGFVEARFTNILHINLDASDTPGGGAFRYRNVDSGEWVANMFNSKFWNYSTGGVTLNPTDWSLGFENFYDWDSGTDPNVDTFTEGGLDISDAAELIPLDGRKLATFKPGSIELTLASDGGQIGYRVPDTAPAGPLPVTTGEVVPVGDWSLY